jgi:hypothetical protein
MEVSGFESRGGQEVSLFKMSKGDLGPTQPSIQWVSISAPEVNRPESKSDHTFPSIVDFKNVRGYTSAPPIRLHVVDRGNCTFFRRVKEGLGLLVLWERW